MENLPKVNARNEYIINNKIEAEKKEEFRIKQSILQENNIVAEIQKNYDQGFIEFHNITNENQTKLESCGYVVKLVDIHSMVKLDKYAVIWDLNKYNDSIKKTVMYCNGILCDLEVHGSLF